jgi:uncharacterized protein (TIGR00297 family)
MEAVAEVCAKGKYKKNQVGITLWLSMTLAYVAAATIALLGYWAKALSLGGAIAACIVGGTILGFGGWAWAISLVLFFATSSALSFFKKRDTRKLLASETFDKGGRRDATQVIANGGVGALFALCSFFTPPYVALLFCAYIGSLAAATADTWATEIGVLSRTQPRIITTMKPVAPGTSGGITWLGSGASAAGALIVSLAATFLAATPLFTLQAQHQTHPLTLLAGGLAGGMVGALTDSLLGATVQASYLCPRCDKPTESRVHKCGTPTRLVRGRPWISNDVVNLAATLTGALVSGAFCRVLYN